MSGKKLTADEIANRLPYWIPEGSTMKVETHYDIYTEKILIKVSDKIHGHVSSIKTAFSIYDIDEMYAYIASCPEFFSEFRRLIKPKDDHVYF